MENLPIMSLKQAQKELDCSKTFIYNCIRDRNLTVQHIGRKPYLLKSEILGLLENKKEAKN